MGTRTTPANAAQEKLSPPDNDNNGSNDKSMVGVQQLLIDLQRLSEDPESADLVFVVDRDEERVYAHKIILMARYNAGTRTRCRYVLVCINQLSFSSRFRFRFHFQMQKFPNNQTRRILSHIGQLGVANDAGKSHTHTIAARQCRCISSIYSLRVHGQSKPTQKDSPHSVDHF